MIRRRRAEWAGRSHLDLGELARDTAAAIRRRVRRPQREAIPAVPKVARAQLLRGPRLVALVLIAMIVTAASAGAFAESYHGLYLWALGHRVTGGWARVWPLTVDVFVAVPELALFVAILDHWPWRARVLPWTVAIAGLGVSVAANGWHLAQADLAARGTAAMAPLSAAASLALGLGILKRIAARPLEAPRAARAAQVTPAPRPPAQAPQRPAQPRQAPVPAPPGAPGELAAAIASAGSDREALEVARASIVAPELAAAIRSAGSNAEAVRLVASAGHQGPATIATVLAAAGRDVPREAIKSALKRARQQAPPPGPPALVLAQAPGQNGAAAS